RGRAPAARQLPPRGGVLGGARRGDRVDRPALRRRRRQRDAGGRAHPAPVGGPDACRAGPRATLPHDPRPRQDPRRARRLVPRRARLRLTVLDRIRDTALHGKRLARAEGRYLLSEAPLLEVGALAGEVRFARLPERVVTFVIDTNPTYTNVCVT